MVRYATTHCTLALCNRAADMLKRAGFIHHNTSMKTEAAYYRWPDRPHQIRVAAHGRHQVRNKLVKAYITFRGTHRDPPGMMNISEEKIEAMVAQAIGRYFLRSEPAP